MGDLDSWDQNAHVSFSFTDAITNGGYIAVSVLISPSAGENKI